MPGDPLGMVGGEWFGQRFRLTGQLPTGALVLLVGLLLESGAPRDSPSLATLSRHLDRRGAAGAVALALGIVAAAVLLQPLQLGIVRTLEGYPFMSGVGRLLGRPLLALQAWRWSRTKKRTASEGSTPGDRARRAAAGARLQRLPAKDRLMPTRLGNTLRAGEDRARTRYGFETVVLWPQSARPAPFRDGRSGRGPARSARRRGEDVGDPAGGGRRQPGPARPHAW